MQTLSIAKLKIRRLEVQILGRALGRRRFSESGPGKPAVNPKRTEIGRVSKQLLSETEVENFSWLASGSDVSAAIDWNGLIFRSQLSGPDHLDNRS